MQRVGLVFLILFFLVSCTGPEVEVTNESIGNAIELLDSIDEGKEVTLTLTGKTTKKELLLFKEALVALEYKSVGNGYLTIDMTNLSGIEELDIQYFGNMSMLKSVKLPKSLTGVTKYLFFRCRYLKDVTIENNATYIGYGAFANCESLEKIYIKSGILEVRAQAFVNLNKGVQIKLEKDQNLVMYYLNGQAFDKLSVSTFEKYLPTTEFYDVSRKFISKEGTEVTLNFSIKYYSDENYLYLLLGDNSNSKKIVSMLKAENANLKTADTEIDGFLADVVQGNQKITITQPEDGSKWYITKNPDVFYAWDKKRAYAIPFEKELIVNGSYYEYYFFKAK